MNINGISNDSGNAISSLLALKNNNPSAVSGDTSTSSTSGAATSSTLSKPGELMAKLNQLLQQDPTKFKQVTQQISDELKSQASSASGPQAQFLSKLSDNFAQAATSGSLASLQPPAGEHSGAAGAHHHHGGHHAGGAGGAGGGIEAVLPKALDEVNQALSSSSTSATGSTSGA